MRRGTSRGMLRASGLATLALLATFIVVGCQSIVGIEDRTYQPGSQQCADYCNTMQKNCTQGNAVYPDKATCLAVCADLPPGGPSAPANSNTVSCRARLATLAGSSQVEYCASAGPGGNGSCGNDCEAYCTLLQAICPDDYKAVASVRPCTDSCKALEDEKGFSAAQQQGDTVQCRLVHLMAAAKDPAAAAAECPHASFQTPDEVCKHDPKTTADCKPYCRAVMAACTGKFQQYASEAECEKVCADLSPGTYGDTLGKNTVGCRYYHAFNALGDPAGHCPHAGPGGDGVCSQDNCESYCELMQAGCSSVFGTRYPGGLTKCEDDCRTPPAITGGAAQQLYSSNGDASQMVTCLQKVSTAITDRATGKASDADSVCQKLAGDGC